MSITFGAFAHFEADRLWHGVHLRTSLSKVDRFAAFEDYSSRLITDYLPSHIHSYFEHLIAKGLKPNTVNHHGAMIGKVFKHAAREEVIRHVPRFTWMTVEGTARPLYYTREQLDAMEAYFHDGHPQAYMRHLIIIGYNTGMRRGEMMQINRKTLHRDEHGHQWVYLEKTKNGSDRYVPINGKALSSIRALWQQSPDYMFAHDRFYNAWGDMRRRVLGNDKRYTFHTLRHTCATNLANDLNAQTEVVGAVLGHKCLTTTRKYIKVKPMKLQEIMGRL